MLAGLSTAWPLVHGNGMGLQMESGVFEAAPLVAGKGFGRCRFAQCTKLDAGERKPFHQDRHKLAASIDRFRDRWLAESVGDAGIEAKRLTAPLHTDGSGLVAIKFMGEKPHEQLRFASTPAALCVEVRQVAREQLADVLNL
jgi:hypothetical protein